MKIAYQNDNISRGTLQLIETADQIATEYARAGFSLTLRQLYYQFVARGLLPNKQTEYKRLGRAVNLGRLNGLISWKAIEDRTRELEHNPHWRRASTTPDSEDTPALLISRAPAEH